MRSFLQKTILVLAFLAAASAIRAAEPAKPPELETRTVDSDKPSRTVRRAKSKP